MASKEVTKSKEPMLTPAEHIPGDAEWTAGRLIGLAIITLALAFSVIYYISLNDY